ncbi:MAG: type II secretion system secretin GspD [Desulfobulbus sp.]|nr:type II secretion system secretin GspD [Desulfobulbus sp.]
MNHKRMIGNVLLCCMVAWMAGLVPCGAANPKISQPTKDVQRYVTIDFNDVDINLFIKYISELTKKNFIVDRQVQGKVTVISPTQVSAEDAYRVFESVLEVHGYAAVPSGSVIKIVPSVEARSKSIATLKEGERPSGEDKVVTQIIALKYANADEVKGMLSPLVSKTSVLISHAKSGMIILTDYASNIMRLLDIINAVDVPPDNEDMVIIPLYHASADNVAKALSQLFVSSPSQRGVRPEVVKIIPFERTNTLIVFATKSSVERVRGVVAKLDADVPRREGNLHVVYLQHANAEELVKVLMNLPDEQSGTRSTSAPSGKTSSMPSAPAISKEIKIVADKETNSLIITGPREEFEVVDDVIKQLDIPRRMVYLEALIMEVKVSKNFNIGVQWADGSGSVIGGFSGKGGDNAYDSLKALQSGKLPAGFSLGVLDKGITIGDVTFPNLGAVVNAYKSDDDVNVIATPQILTTDNKKASIKVGENVPYITSKNTTSSDQDYTNYEYKDVATSLTITPQVNRADIVRLEIGVEVVKLKDTDTTTTPSTFTRTADTTVIVHNEETVVIGGMIGQDTTKGEYKVPLLGDVPVLGWLFKSHSNSLEKTNLYIFITPHIVENPAELADIYHKKRSKIEELHREPGDVADEFFHPTSDPRQSIALSDIGMSKLMQNDLVRAREYFVQALKNDPNNGSALINLGSVCEREQKWQEAKTYYQRVLALPAPKQGEGDDREDPLKAVAKNALKRLQQRGI